MSNAVSNTVPQATFYSVAREHIQEPVGFQRMVIYPVRRALLWYKYFNGPLSGFLAGVDKSYKFTNHAIEWIKLPGSMNDVLRNVDNVRKYFLTQSYTDVTSNAVWGWINLGLVLEVFSDFAKILHAEELITLSKTHLVAVGVLGFWSSSAYLTIGTLLTYRNVKKMSESTFNSPEFNLATMHAIRRLSLIVIGLSGVLPYLALGSISTPVVLTAATNILIFGLASHFYDKLAVANQG